VKIDKCCLSDIVNSLMLKKDSLKRLSICPLSILLFFMVVVNVLIVGAFYVAYTYFNERIQMSYSDIIVLVSRNFGRILLVSAVLACMLFLFKKLLSKEVSLNSIVRAVILISLLRPIVLVISVFVSSSIINVIYLFYCFFIVKRFLEGSCKNNGESLTGYILASFFGFMVTNLLMIRIGLHYF